MRKHSLNKSQIILVGTKNDLVSERAVEKTEAEALAKQQTVIYHEVSSVTGDGIQALFKNAAEIVLEVLKKRRDSVVGITVDDSSYTSFSADGPDSKKSFFNKCCSG